MVNSGDFDGLPSEVAWDRIAEDMVRRGIGERKIHYRIHDWLISRQRYWGTPIPIIYCDGCGTVPVPYEDLPVRLPEDAEFKPTGESPLKYHAAFLNVACPRCGKPARRETDTMDTFIDSSWYQYRYLSPHDATRPFDPALAKQWLPVHQYTGGIEHAVMHLLYTRFWTKAMRDMGITDLDEPMTRLFNQGIILGPDGNRMSKSKGNVINPDEFVEKHGADVLRTYLMFIGPWDAGGPWNSRGIEGVARFLGRAWSLASEPVAPGAAEPAGAVGAETMALRELEYAMHHTIKRVTDDLEQFKWNTAIAALMEFSNTLQRARQSTLAASPLWQDAIKALVLMLAPLAPHLAEEMWVEVLGQPYSVHLQPWPVYDAAKATAERTTLVLQVNGKVRDRVEVEAAISDAEARELALANPRVRQFLDGKILADVIVVSGRLVNVVVR
jgi:leucyl-tRNA synthetase